MFPLFFAILKFCSTRHVFKIFIVLFSNHVLLILLCTGFGIDKGVKRLGEFLSILNIKCLQLYFQAEIQ